MTLDATPLRNALPGLRAASAPPEARGLARDEVRLMVASPGRIVDASFRRLAEFLAPGDLLVVNTSPTMAAAVAGTRRRRPVVVHLSTPLDDGRWVVELRRPDGSGPVLDDLPGEVVGVAGGSIVLEEAADGSAPGAVRLWRATVDVAGGVRSLMRRHGSPIRYGYVTGEWPLSMYQTIFADLRRWPGSAEMPSAGRPFTARVLRALRRAGVRLAAVELHTGVSSQEAHEPPQPERFAVPPQTAALVAGARRLGGRVIAVGTTVTRALESAGVRDGTVVAASGWTDLVLGPDRPARIVDGLITGWHPPEASHLDLLRAVASPELVASAYDRALAGGYLWHEFGDSCLLLGERLQGAGEQSARADSSWIHERTSGPERGRRSRGGQRVRRAWRPGSGSACSRRRLQP